MIKVTLISHTPEPEKLIAACAKMCYSASNCDEILDGLTDEKTHNFIGMLSEIGHESPVEHASFTFAIEGVSRSLLAQITRHRIASFSVQSQRYVSEKNFEYVVPPQIEKNAQAKELYMNAMQRNQEDYNKISDMLYISHLEAQIEAGKSENQAKIDARKLANEDARFVLPNACTTKIMMTMNVRSLYNFFRLRCCNRAQWEIREAAQQMLFLCKAVAPTLFSKAGPACVGGACSEGKMSCGKASEVRALYSERA